MMLDEIRFPFRVSKTGLSWRVWVGSRVTALVLGLCIVWALANLTPIQLPLDPPAIQAVVASSLDVPPPPIVQKPNPDLSPKTTQSPQKALAQPSRAASPATPSQIPAVQDRPTLARVAPEIVSPAQRQVGVPNDTIVGVAAAPPSQGPTTSAAKGQQGPQGTAAAPQLGSATRGILRARECARLDVRDRPADCPPNEELARLLAAERGPKYRPENADAFSRNELAWRGIPPPCLDDGKNAAIKGTTLCIRFGNVPSRVRSVREICEARGLGGCADAPSQTAINAALEQVRRQEAAKAP